MLKTVIFNTSNRMIPLIEEINNISEIKLCITKNDVKVGRKKTLINNVLKSWCIKNNIEYLQISDLKADNTKKIVEILSNIDFDLGVVVDFNYIIPNSIISKFPKKLINIHYSLLPKYRGASPIQFSILNGDNKTGITYQVLDQKMDMGNILQQNQIILEGNENSDTLFDKLLHLNITTINTFLNNFENNIIFEEKQNDDLSSYTYSKSNPNKTVIFKEDAFIDFTENVEVIEKMIRAFYPWPIVWTKLIYLSKYLEVNLKPSVNKDLIVKIYSARIKDEKLIIEKLQIQGKSVIDFASFINGYTIK